MEELVVDRFHQVAVEVMLMLMGCMGIGKVGKGTMACCNERKCGIEILVHDDEFDYHGWQIGWHPQFPLAADGPPNPPNPPIIPPMFIPGIIPIPGNCPSTALATPSLESKISSELAMAPAKMLNKTIAAVKKEYL
jgi:hypothetical protein